MFVVLALLSFLFIGSTSLAETRVESGEILGSTEWSGRITVAGLIEIASGATLKIAPGTVITFSRSKGESPPGMTIKGALLAIGTAEAPIHFRGMPGESPAWSGLVFDYGRGEPNRLVHCRIENAEIGISGQNAILMAEHLTIAGNLTGAKAGVGFQLHLKWSQVTGNGTGLLFSQNAVANIDSCLVEKNLFYGIVCEGSSPRLKKSVIKSNGKVGIVARNGSSGAIEDNRISGHEMGIEIEKKSTLFVTHNDIHDNDIGISLGRMGFALVEKNSIHHNNTGIFCNYSGYPTIRKNNLIGNTEWALDLGPKQSAKVSLAGPYDKREEIFAEKSGPLHLRKRDGVSGASLNIPPDGLIEASGNWWGESIVAEMSQKGGHADISVIEDFYDQASLEFQGHVYPRDRFGYFPFSPEPVGGAGPRVRLPN